MRVRYATSANSSAYVRNAVVVIILCAAGCAEQPARDAAADAPPAAAVPAQAATSADSTDHALDLSMCRDAADYNACAADQERSLIERSPGIARNGDTLTITVRNGRPVLLVDSLDENSVGWEYLYSGRVQAAKAHLIAIQLYEGGGFILVSEETGRVSEIDAPPILSPDRMRFVTVSADTEAGYNPNRVQIYRLDADSVILEWQTEPSAWEPTDPRWLNDTTVAIVRRPAFHTVDSLALRVPLTLRRQGSSWTADSVR